MSNRPYDTARWKRVRIAILQRDGWTCADCHGTADRVDHIVPWRQGGAWYEPSNLQAVCRSCNTKRAYRTGGRSAKSAPFRTELTW